MLKELPDLNKPIWAYTQKGELVKTYTYIPVSSPEAYYFYSRLSRTWYTTLYRGVVVPTIEEAIPKIVRIKHLLLS